MQLDRRSAKAPARTREAMGLDAAVAGPSGESIALQLPADGGR